MVSKALQLQRLRDSIKRKHRAFKTGVIESEELIEKRLKPLVEPLKQIASKTRVKNEIKEEEEEQEEEEEENFFDESPTPSQSSLQPVTSTPLSHRSTSSHPLIDSMSDTNPTKHYLQLLITDKGQMMDLVYGVYFKNNNMMIGNKVVTFGHRKLTINKKTYELTSGLHSLVFEKVPKEYTNADLKSYHKILMQTNAHLQGYNPDRQVNSNRGFKYMNIIKPLLKKRTGDASGRGMVLTSNKIDYVHWDDPNELCDRLRLLLASQGAGNLGHVNEIQSIVEELRESRIIKGGEMKGNNHY